MSSLSFTKPIIYNMYTGLTKLASDILIRVIAVGKPLPFSHVTTSNWPFFFFSLPSRKWAVAAPLRGGGAWAIAPSIFIFILLVSWEVSHACWWCTSICTNFETYNNKKFRSEKNVLESPPPPPPHRLLQDWRCSLAAQHRSVLSPLTKYPGAAPAYGHSHTNTCTHIHLPVHVLMWPCPTYICIATHVKANG